MGGATRLLEALATLLERLVTAVLAGLVVVVFLMVSSLLIDRYVVRVPITAPDEVSKIALVWMTFLGFALALNDRTNIRVDLIDRYLTRRQLVWLETFFDVLIVAMLLLIVAKSWILVEIGQSQAILGTPFNAGLTNLGLFVGGILMVFFMLARMVRRVAVRGGEAR